jgi:hypothetical protein
MNKKLRLVDVKKLIEVNGELFTPEELIKEKGISGDFEISVNESDDTWFGRAMQTLRDKTKDQ